MHKETQLDTLPKILRHNFNEWPERIAMREKTRGIWKRYTWKEYYEKVKFFSLGLVKLGLKRGEHVAIIGENKPEWYIGEIAAQAVGCTAVGIHTDCPAAEVKFFVEHSDAIFVIAHDQEQVDKLLDVKDQLPLMKHVIYWEPKGLWDYDDAILLSFDEVIELGQEYETSAPAFFDHNVDQGSNRDIAVLCYTSGTTGTPKGSMLSQDCLIMQQSEWCKQDNWMGKGYSYVSFIPPSWATEQMFGITGGLLGSSVVNFPEAPETVQEDLREIGPEVLFYGARLWEMVSRTIQARMMDSTWLRRFIYRISLHVGLKVARLRSENKRVSFLWRFLNFLAYQSSLRQLRDNLGFSRVKVAYSVGAAISPEIVRFFLALGIEIELFYGSTELGTISLPHKGEIRPETSGPIVPWAEVKISDEGEILAKTKYLHLGYYKDEKATKAKMVDGWYQTGDFGYMDEDEHLIVIDRMEDLQPLSTGKKFSPVYAEVRLRFSPYIKDVLVVGGDTKDHVIALINIDMENVGRFAESNRISYTTFTDLSQKRRVIELIEKELRTVNKTVPEYARIKTFVNLHKEFDADEAELTRTRKIRRAFVEKRYEDLIEAMYSKKSDFKVKTTVLYRDGRTAVIQTSINLTSVEEA